MSKPVRNIIGRSLVETIRVSYSRPRHRCCYSSLLAWQKRGNPDQVRVSKRNDVGAQAAPLYQATVLNLGNYFANNPGSYTEHQAAYK